MREFKIKELLEEADQLQSDQDNMKGEKTEIKPKFDALKHCHMPTKKPKYL